jgi:hypothetical protein
MQKHWDLQRDGKSQDIVGTLKRKTPTNTQESLTNDPLDWCLVQMLGEPDNQKGFNHAMLFAMLHEHLASNPSERNRLDEVVYQVLSDLSTCHEMLLAVRLHRPQNKPRTLTETKHSEDRPAWKWLRSCKESESAFTRLDNMGGSLLRDFYLAKPPTGPKTAAWLAQSRPLHSAIEKFWERMRDWMRMDFADSDFSVVEIDSFLQVISANLDNDYLQEREREEAAILSSIDDSQRPDFNFSFPGEIDSYSRLKLDLPRREKTKTRRGGQGDLNDILPTHDTPSNREPEATAPLEQTRATTIKVSKQSLEVFLLMFPEKQAGESSRHLQWDEFVHAMVDAGFTARNSSGSAVAFISNMNIPDSTSGGGGGRVVFHKPHPVPKIDSILLQVMGKRMAKWFGWRREVFESD